MANFNNDRSNHSSNNPIVCGKVIKKGLSRQNGKPFMIIEYKNLLGEIETASLQEFASEFQVDDTVYFKILDKGFKKALKNATSRLGKIVRAANTIYATCQDGSRYYLNNEIDADTKYVELLVDKFVNEYTGKETVHLVTPVAFPAALIDEDDSVNGRYTGRIIPHKLFIAILTDEHMRNQYNLQEKYFISDENAKWFFVGDSVSFELAPANKSGFIDATNLKKKRSVLSKLSDLPEDLFSKPLEITPFQNHLLKTGEGFRKSMHGYVQKAPKIDGFNANTSGHSTKTILGNITTNLFLSDKEYLSPLSRFKPCFDSAVPYLYAIELGENPTSESLEWNIIDGCDFLNILMRTQNSSLSIKIDEGNQLYARFAELIRYYVFKKAIPISNSARLYVALTFSAQECWSDDDNLKLLKGSCYEETYQTPSESNIRALFEKAADARQIGILCDLICKKYAKAGENQPIITLLSEVLKVCGADALDAFASVEQSTNEYLLKGLCDDVSNPDLLRYIDEKCNGNFTNSSICADFDIENSSDIANYIISEFNINGLSQWSLKTDFGELEGRLLNTLYKKSQAADCNFDYKLIAALIILYAKRGEFIKSRFLYSHFIRHRTISEMQLLKTIRTQIGRQSTNEYANDVVYYAFTHLPPDELYEFACWVTPMFKSAWAANFVCDITDISIDPMKPMSTQANVNTNADTSSSRLTYSYYFAKILLDSTNASNWHSFPEWFKKSEHLLNFRNKLIYCICNAVLRIKFNWFFPQEEIGNQLFPLLKTKKNRNQEDYTALIYCAFDYIQNGFDRDGKIAEAMLSSLDSQILIIPDGAEARIDAFCNYCKQQLEELKKPLFANLIINLKSGRMSADEIVLVAPFASKKNLIYEELISAYENGADSHTVNTLINALKRNELHSTPISRAVYEIWNSVIFVKETLNDGYDTLPQACVDILKDYPQKNALEECLKSAPSAEFKLLIHSYFVGLYKERNVGKLFKNLLKELEVDELCKNARILDLYLKCVEKQSLAELYFNSAYEDFYKYRRYVKIALAYAVRENKEHLDLRFNEIKAMIRQHGHADLAESFGFDSFIKNLSSLLTELESFDSTHKSYLMLCLLGEDMTPYFEKYGNDIEAEKLPSLKMLLRHCDFREIQSKFFISSYASMSNEEFDTVLTRAQLLSDEMYEIVRYLQAKGDRELLEKAAYFFDEGRTTPDGKRITPALAVAEIINMSDDMGRHENFWKYVICAKQLPSKIFGEVRNRIVAYAEKDEERIEFALDVLDLLGKEEKSYFAMGAEACQNYLSCLYDYFRGKTVRSRYVDEIVTGQLPKTWVSEAERFIDQYENKTFIADNISNRSFGSSRKAMTFLSRAAEEFDITIDRRYDDSEFSYEVFEEIYCNGASNVEENAAELIKSSMLWLQNVRDAADDEFRTVAIALGLLIHNYESASAGLKLCAWIELHQRYGNQIENTGADTEKYINELIEDLKIEDWLNHYASISRIIGTDFDNARKCCFDIWDQLQKLNVSSLDKENCSEADLLCALDISFDVYESDEYLKAIYLSGERKKDELKKRKLSVSCEGIKDSFVYFSVKNNGTESLDLSKSLEIGLSKIDIGLNELRPGWITGFRCPLPVTSELTVVIKGHSKGDLPIYRESFDLSLMERQVSEDCERSTYNLHSLSAKDELFGRGDTMKDIKRYLDNTGFAIITGPSRVGKTSILNHIEAYAKGKGAHVFAISDPDHYLRPVDSMADYLLLESLYAIGDEKINRLIDDGRNKKWICDIYEDAIKALGEREIWLIFDEFQQVVNPEEQTVDEQENKSELCQMSIEDMKAIEKVLQRIYDLPEKQIKIIFCGSDRLHKEINRSNSDWRRVFKPDQENGINNHVTVNNIDYESFEAMLRSNKEVDYTEDAITAAASYSSQIPLYGKHICNKAINDAKGKLFCYDIAAATNAMFKGNNVADVIEPVYKGLAEEDLLYLEYIAKSLALGEENKEILQLLTDEFGDHNVMTCLNYAKEARLLLKGNEGSLDFSSVFFYKVFCEYEKSRTPDEILNRLRDIAKHTRETMCLENAATAIKALNDNQRGDLLKRKDLFSQENIDNVAKTTNIYNVAGDYNETKNEQHIGSVNLQLNALLTSNMPAEELIQVFNGLFGEGGRFNSSTYLTQETKQLLLEAKNGDIELSPENYAEVERSKEQVGKELMNAIPFEDWFDISDERKMELLGLKDDPNGAQKLESLLVLKDYASQLGYAIKIHDVLLDLYHKAGEDVDRCKMIDFSPVSILYCKIVEKMLNDKHKPLYENCLQPGDYDIPANKKYTIGTFKFPICQSKDNPQNWMYCQEDLANATGTSETEWLKHALYIDEMVKIRNDTAHLIDPLDFQKFNELVKIMFSGNIKEVAKQAKNYRNKMKNNFKRPLSADEKDGINKYINAIDKEILGSQINDEGELMLIWKLGTAKKVKI